MRRRASLRVSHQTAVDPFGLEVRNLPKPIAGRFLFGNEHPLEVEIGVGKGAFLVGEASSRTDTNFIGIERARRYWLHASDRLRRQQCWNARAILVDAGYFLAEFVPDTVLTAVYVHFPDPWPKKRHHKRRLIQPALVEQVERVLVSGGRLQVVTDHLEYFEQIEAIVRSSSLLPRNYQRPMTVGSEELLVGSNFERKYRRAGKTSYAIAAVKK